MNKTPPGISEGALRNDVGGGWEWAVPHVPLNDPRKLYKTVKDRVKFYLMHEV